MNSSSADDGFLSRRPIIGTSWKMNLTPAETRAYIRRLRESLGATREAAVFVLPPYTSIEVAADELAGSSILYGAQNVHHEDQGAYTGEISAPMLAALGCRIVEVGHSERRRDQCETDELIARKVDAILRHDLWPLVCIGESGAQRDAGTADAVVRHQLEVILGGLEPDALGQVLMAYEPWWAIGVGAEAAPADHVARLHGLIHDWLAERGPGGRNVPVLYGGSVDLGSAGALLDTLGVDGLFVGRAALDPDVFARIVMTAPAVAEGHPSSAGPS